MDIREISHVQEGPERPLSKTVAAKRVELILAARWLGEHLSRRSFGERGPDWKVTLAHRARFLRPLGPALAGGFRAVSAREPAQRLAETWPCPPCGREGERPEHARTLPTAEEPVT